MIVKKANGSGKSGGGGKGGGGGGFKGLDDYLEKNGKGKDRYADRFGNAVSSMETAAAEMQETADLIGDNDAVGHMIISFPKCESGGKSLSPEIHRNCVCTIMESLGYENHQWKAVVHRDTDNDHIHIAFCKFDPNTL